jgi:alpha-1,2-mannosyltransferase
VDEDLLISRTTDNFQQTSSVTPWVLRGGAAVAATSLVAYVTAYLCWPTLRMQVDLMVYRFAAERLLSGLDLYSIGLTGKPGEMLFIYPPFAAISAVPLALLDTAAMQWLWLAGAIALLIYLVVRMLTYMGMRAGLGLAALSALLVGLSAWLEPIRLTAELGQINLVLLALVVADLLSRSKWLGIGVGLAAGIKLTPALFIVYLLVTKRIRAAVVASLTFAATVVIGFAVAPSDSVTYWLRGRFDDVHRISHDPIANTSVGGLVLRLHGSPTLSTVASAVVAVVALVIAAAAYRHGQAVLAIAIVGMASAAASPFSWSHHWVWFVPLVVHLGHRGYAAGSRLARAAMWSVCALVGGWIVTAAGDTPQAGILSLRPGGVWGQILPGTYVFVLLAVALAAAVWLRRNRVDVDLTDVTVDDLERHSAARVAG